MYQTIMVPLDGSPLAERALPFAKTLATASHGRILLFRAVTLPTFGLTDPAIYQARAMYEAESYLADIAQRIAPAPPIETIVVTGDAAPMIFEEIREHAVDLVVMSTHGRSGVGRWIYGSVADEIMRQANVPVLLVPASIAITWPTDRAPRILVPLDGSLMAEEALETTRVMAKTLGAELQLLEVKVPLTYTYADPAAYMIYEVQEQEFDAQHYLETIAARLRADGLAVTTFQAIGPAATMIASTAVEQGSDLIAMSTHASGGVTRLLMGSVATGVIQHSSVPVMIVRPVAVRELSEAPEHAAATLPLPAGT
jgi:nucleotide-binding universal stress UspA family protein